MKVTDADTIALSKSDVTLFQALSGANKRRPCLVLYSGADVGRPFALDPGTLTIGRTADAQVHLDSPGISRQHAELLVTEETVTLRDLGSINGSHVNDVRVETTMQLREGDLVRLGNLVLKFYEHQSLEAALHDRIYRMATIDAATEVFNRRYFFDALRRELRLTRQAEKPLAVICYDLDHFKRVNDTHGHAAGDVVLKQSTDAVRASLHGAGILARLGGEEFAVMLPHTDAAQAAEVADRLRRAVADHAFELPDGTVHRQTISLGVAALDNAMADVTDLLEAADRKLYVSKHAGRNRVTS